VVSISACHAEGRGFKSRRLRQERGADRLGNQAICRYCLGGHDRHGAGLQEVAVTRKILEAS